VPPSILRRIDVPPNVAGSSTPPSDRQLSTTSSFSDDDDGIVVERMSSVAEPPSGGQFEYYRHVQIPTDEPPPPAPVQPTDDELELERDMEYFVEPEEALGPRTGDLGE
jgi:hypothetical protein